MVKCHLKTLFKKSPTFLSFLSFLTFPKMISIIIPTYKRSEHIKQCLEAISKQNRHLEDTEVIIIDDGGDAETQKYIQEKKETFPFEIKYLVQAKKGRSAARNLGIKNAKGEVIIFIGDDIVVTPDWLESHAKFHNEKPEKEHIAVGHITWHPKLPIDRYMTWLENGGPLLSFKGLQDGQRTDMWHFYTGNISLKKELIEQESFNEEIDLYGWEDIELGARLEKNHSMQIWYLKKALAYHNHLYEEKGLESYAENLGYSASAFQKNLQGVQLTPTFPKRTAFAIISSLTPVLRQMKTEWYWYAVLKRNFLRGMRRYQMERK